MLESHPRFSVRPLLRALLQRLPANLVQRTLLAVLPAAAILGVAGSTVWGDDGLLARSELEQELETASARLSKIDRENQRLLHELQVMSEDPVVMERVVAEELSRGKNGAIIYRFDAEPAAISH